MIQGVAGFVLLAAVALGLLYYWKRPVAGLDAYPFESQTRFLAPKEVAFYPVLLQAVAGRYSVFARVRLADVIDAKAKMSPARRLSAQNRILRKSVSFVLCDPAAQRVAGVITLDSTAPGGDTDDFIGRALKAAGVPRVCVPESEKDNVVRIQALIQSGIEEHGRRSALPAVGDGAEAPDAEKRVCPQCGALMEKQQAQRGRHAGKFFYVCSRFPGCPKIIPLDAEQDADSKHKRG